MMNGKMDSKTVLHVVAFTLVVVGAVNWGLVGAFDYNLVKMLLGAFPLIEKVVYILVGVSGLYLAAMHKDDCMMCSKM